MENILVASKTCRVGMSQEELKKLFRERKLNPTFKSLKNSFDQLENYDGIIIGTEVIEEKHIDKAKRLKVIMKFGIGTDNIDKSAAEKKHIKILNMPGINSNSVAEMTFSLMMSVTRRIVEGDRKIRKNLWPRLIGISPIGKTMGIIGTGAIGTKLANLVSVFNMEIIGYDPVKNADFTTLGGKYVEMDELLSKSDYISIHVPLIKSTYHLIGEREFSLMKRGAIVLNTSRGGIINEQALYEALSNKQIFGAGVDVLGFEPPSESPLLELENIVCTPHIAAYDYETLSNMSHTCVLRLKKELDQLS